MREFRVLPHGLKVENLIDVQKTFIFYLMAAVPRIEEMAHVLRYKNEKRAITKRKYEKELNQRSDVMEAAARASGVSVEQYLESQRKTLREQDMRKLNERYNIKDDKANDDRIKNLQRLQAMSEQYKQSNILKEIFEKKEDVEQI